MCMIQTAKRHSFPIGSGLPQEMDVEMENGCNETGTRRCLLRGPDGRRNGSPPSTRDYYLCDSHLALFNEADSKTQEAGWLPALAESYPV
jgi:hypothetical protein